MFDTAVLVANWGVGVQKRSGIAGNLWDQTTTFPATTPPAVVRSFGAGPDLVHVGDQNGLIHTFDYATLGDPLASVPAADPPIDAIVRGIRPLDQRVYATVGNALCAVDPMTGPLWRYDMDDLAWGTPLAVGDVIVAGSWDDRLHALHPDGTVAWVASQAEFFASWPVGGDGVVYARAGAVMHAIDAADGTTQWTATSEDGSTYMGATLDEDHVYVATAWGGSLDAIRRSDGTRAWRADIPGHPGDPAVGFGKVFVGTEHGASPRHLFALDAVTGAQVWKSPVPVAGPGYAISRPAVALADVPYVFVTGSDGFQAGRTYAFAWNDGWFAWKEPGGAPTDPIDPVWVDEPVQEALAKASSHALAKLVRHPEIRRDLRRPTRPGPPEGRMSSKAPSDGP